MCLGDWLEENIEALSLITSKPNKQFFFSYKNVDGTVRRNAKTFYSRFSDKYILEEIRKNQEVYFSALGCESVDMSFRISILDKLSGKFCSTTIKVCNCVDIGCKIRDIVITDLLQRGIIVDCKQNRYQITVRSMRNNINDVRTFVFNTSQDFDSVFSMIKNFLKSYKDDKPQVFLNKESLNKTSHCVILCKAGSVLSMRSGTRSLTVKLPGYSSLDVVKILKGENDEE